MAGECLRLWAAGHLEKSKEVTRSGPYRHTRHPLYLGSSIIGIGIALGDALGTMFTRLYAEFFRFPAFQHRIAPWLLVVSLTLSAATAVLGTVGAAAVGSAAVQFTGSLP